MGEQLKNAKFVYIAHPIGGDVISNIERVIKIVREITMYKTEVIPFAPYLVDLLVLKDNVAEERKRGMWHNEQVFRSGIISEVWLFGPRISSGMAAEVRLANELGIPVYAQNNETERDLMAMKMIDSP